MSDFKGRTKKFLQRALMGTRPSFVIASFGRSGSTLIYDGVIDGLVRDMPRVLRPLTKRLAANQSWALSESELMRGCVYKTHDYPEGLSSTSDVKCIFLFGSLADAALSVHSSVERFGEDWTKLHFKHLKSDDSHESILDFDVLRFEDQMRRWGTYREHPVLCLRYDRLWENQNVISDFCGFPVVLPAKRERVAKSYRPDLVAQAQSTYGQLDEFFGALPDSFIAGTQDHILAKNFDSDNV
ncbi:hypothetical protein JET14_10000 [Martelella lutilitoris]|uniref:Sulfotransferase n=1 Tax=Martelella lutilitoris TaxID=2583532 RepID=A0A7T7HNG4_9HYPH|nr:hypothetical protein [Martelella lutilitoris]QQM32439.1 hypothetical protein JET14_10000 [Martelella lutilitoris]